MDSRQLSWYILQDASGHFSPCGTGPPPPLELLLQPVTPLCLGPQVIYEVHQIRNLLPLPSPHTNAFPFSTAPGIKSEYLTPCQSLAWLLPFSLARLTELQSQEPQFCIKHAILQPQDLGTCSFCCGNILL